MHKNGFEIRGVVTLTLSDSMTIPLSSPPRSCHQVPKSWIRCSSPLFSTHNEECLLHVQEEGRKCVCIVILDLRVSNTSYEYHC